MRSKLVNYLLGIAFLCLVMCCVLLWNAATIVEALINQSIQEQGVTVDVSSLRYQAEDGLVALIRECRNETLVIEQVEVTIPILGMLFSRDQLSLEMHAERLSLRCTQSVGLEAEQLIYEFKQEVPSLVTQQCERLLNLVESFQIRSLKLEIKTVEVIHSRGSSFGGSGLIVFNSHSGEERLLTLRFTNSDLDFQLQATVDSAVESLSMDFRVQIHEIKPFTGILIRDLADESTRHRQVLSLEKLATGFALDASGYFRWRSDSANALSLAVLGQVGTTRSDMGEGSVSFKPASFGVATNGHDVFRAYLNAPVRELKIGDKMTSEGEFSLRMENQSISAKLTTDNDTQELLNDELYSFDFTNGYLTVNG
ncbi:MAG TPA: hypothetical protein DCX06_01735, partial [Opitutae bacterium]|nr:hypothetical protein [Opitutae bacterium]